MRNYRNTSMAILAAVLTLFTVSCNKDSDDDAADPQNPTPTLACRPKTINDYATRQAQYKYRYDDQKRVSYIGEFQSSPNGYKEVPTIVSYVGDTILFDISNFFGPTYGSKVKYVYQGNRIIFHINQSNFTGLSDTTRYDYGANGLAGRTRRTHDTLPDQPVLYVDSIGYDGQNLPVVWQTKQFDRNGRLLSLVTNTYRYGNQQVAYNPYSPFMLAPGIELIKVSRLLESKTLSDSSIPGSSEITTYRLEGLKGTGNAFPARVTINRGGYPTYSEEFDYECN